MEKTKAIIVSRIGEGPCLVEVIGAFNSNHLYGQINEHSKELRDLGANILYFNQDPSDEQYSLAKVDAGEKVWFEAANDLITQLEAAN
jgi:hypothetical protein